MQWTARTCHYTFLFAHAKGGCTRNSDAWNGKNKTENRTRTEDRMCKSVFIYIYIYMCWLRAYLSNVRVRISLLRRFRSTRHGIASLIPILRANTHSGMCRRWFAVCELGAIKCKITLANITRFTNHRFLQLIARRDTLLAKIVSLC